MSGFCSAHQGHDPKCPQCLPWDSAASHPAHIRVLAELQLAGPELDPDDGRPICRRCDCDYLIEFPCEPAAFCNDCAYKTLDDLAPAAFAFATLVPLLDDLATKWDGQTVYAEDRAVTALMEAYCAIRDRRAAEEVDRG